MAPDLTTTNVLLGVMAAVSLLEAMAVLGVLLGGFLMFRVVQVVGSNEERQVAPAVTRVNAILDDVKGVTSTIRQQSGRVDRLIDWILDGITRRRHHTGEGPPSRVM
jgi:hypothetical protein